MTHATAGRITNTPMKLKASTTSRPIPPSMGVLGKKWSMLVISDIGLMGLHRFNEILHATPGLTPRVLSKRLKDLEKDGFITLVVKRPNWVRWDITQKGRDALPILSALSRFGSKWSPRAERGGLSRSSPI